MISTHNVDCPDCGREFDVLSRAQGRRALAVHTCNQTHDNDDEKEVNEDG